MCRPGWIAALTWLAVVATGGQAWATAGVVVDAQACTQFYAPRIESELNKQGAVGSPWSNYFVSVGCPDGSIQVAVTQRGGQTIEEALFLDPGEVADREAWLADVIVQVVVENWDVPKPMPGTVAPPGAGHQAGSGDREKPQYVEPAPTFSELLGPAFIAIQASYRWLNLAEPNQVAGIGVMLGRQQWKRAAPFLSLSYTVGEGEPAGADVNIRVLQLGAGVLYTRALSRSWAVHVQTGVAAAWGRMVRQKPGMITNEAAIEGWSAAFELAPLMVARVSSTLVGLGPSVGWMLNLPVSRLAGAAEVDVNGAWMGFILHVGSIPGT